MRTDRVRELLRSSAVRRTVSAALALFTFALDLLVPRGVSDGVLYVLPVLLGLWAKDRRHALVWAAVGSVLTVAGAVLSPASTVPSSIVLLNRGLALIGVWTAAAVVVSKKHIDQALAVTAGDARDTLKELSDYKLALDQSSIVAITDVRGIIHYVNDKFCEISKYPREELLGKDHRILNSGYHPKEFMRNLWTTIARGTTWRGEIRNRAKDGSIYWVDTTIVPFLDARGTPLQYVAIRTDITEKKRVEERLIQQAALAQLGTMAAVVAHEVKNPLAGVGGAIQVLRDRLPADSAERSILTEIMSRLDGLNTLIRGLLDFARPKVPRAAPFALLAMLRNTATLLSRDPALSDVQVEISSPGEGVDAMILVADAELLKGVFFNLLLNGAQAMGGHGTLRVMVESAGGRCRIAFSDSGPGIPSELRDKVFEPFFTTKFRGTGLGLPTARRVIEAHHGTLDIACPPEGGTTVTVTLPTEPMHA